MTSRKTGKDAAVTPGRGEAAAVAGRAASASSSLPLDGESDGAAGRGRRPGGPDTRGEILAAARESFAGNGFAATSMRGVARGAGVDAALVHHYFDSKDELFVEAMALPIDPRQVAATVLDGPRDELGVRIVTVFLGVWESPDGQQRMKAFLRSVVSSDQVAQLMRDGIGRLILAPVSEVIGGDDARLRVSLVASQLIGLALTRYLLELEPLASADVPTLIERIAPVLQQYLTD
ncbi:TetR/AcrR family transcriptional regulator [Kribbella endophytica]